MWKFRGAPSHLAAARGDAEVDVLLLGGEVFSTVTKEWIRTDLAISEGTVVGWGARAAAQIVDVSGARITPAFIDAHMHLESTKLWVDEFVKLAVASGTTAVAADPHEIANVFGIPGVQALIEASADLPFTFGICASSCVPASPFESPGSVLGPDDLRQLLTDPRVIGVAEMMNYPGVIHGDPEVLEKIRTAGWRRVDGHAPGVRGFDLDAYITAGVESDHECTTFAEAHEKRQKGMWVFLRQGSAAQNIAELAPSITRYGTTRAALCSDDREPDLLLHRGHVNDCVRVAIESGISLEDALVLATINPAEYHGFNNLGSISPGYQADLLVFDSFEEVRPSQVWRAGELLAESGQILEPERFAVKAAPQWMRESIHLRTVPSASDFDLSLQPGAEVRVIAVREGSIVTREESARFDEEFPGDLAVLAVLERHKATGRIGLGLVRGFGLTEGAIASTVAHDAHNIMVVGAPTPEGREDMHLAVSTLATIGGGQVVCRAGEVRATVPLPIGGLMSTKAAKDVAEELEAAVAAARDNGVDLDNPFMHLSFLGLSVIPELRLTDLGLIDTVQFTKTSLLR
ncbi:MAG: adenine deaminase [Acidimicrobiales bacterium]